MDTLPLSGWENFYVIVGGAAAALIGLTFVVIALIRDARTVHPAGLRGFMSPTIVHFGGVLALAAFMSMPHQQPLTVSVGFIGGGIAGLIYGLFTAASIRRQSTAYIPVGEDWIWNVWVPSLAYLVLTFLGVLVWYRAELALAGVGFLTLALLFVGIRNSWDLAVWMTVHRSKEKDR